MSIQQASDRPRLAFLHLPKTGGTSLSSAIAKRFDLDFVPSWADVRHVEDVTEPDGRIAFRRNVDESLLVPSRIGKSVATLPFIAGHFNIESLRWFGERLVFTVFRDPRLRSISNFIHGRRHGLVPVQWTLVDWLAHGHLVKPPLVGRLGEPRWQGRTHYQAMFQQLMPVELAGHSLLLGEAYLGASWREQYELAAHALESVDLAFFPQDNAEVVDHLTALDLVPRGRTGDVMIRQNVTPPEEARAIPSCSWELAETALVEATVLDLALVSAAVARFPARYMSAALVDTDQLKASCRKWGIIR